MISSEEVKKMADLARIEISSCEAEELQKELEVILDYVSQLQKAPVGATDIGRPPEPSEANGTNIKAPELLNVFRNDEPIKDESDIKRGEYVKVKQIL